MSNRTFIMPDGETVEDIGEDENYNEVLADYEAYSGKTFIDKSTELPVYVMPDGARVEAETADEDYQSVLEDYLAYRDKPTEPTAAEEAGEEILAEAEGSFMQDVAQTYVRSGKTLASVPFRLGAWGAEKAGVEGASENVDWFFNQTARSLVGSVPFVGDRLESALFDSETGDVKESSTIGGMVFEIAPVIAGGSMLAATGAFSALPFMARELAAGITADQLLIDADTNMFNELESATEFDTPEEKEAAKDTFRYTLNTIASGLAAQEDDSPEVKQLKLLAEGAGLGFIAGMVGGLPQLYKQAVRVIGRPASEMTEKELADVAVTYLRESRDMQELRKVEDEIVFNETPEGVQQVMSQSGILTRMMHQVFKSRGYWTPQARNAFENSQQAQRATITQAENTARRLNRELNKIVGDSEDKGAFERAQQALTEDLTLQNFSREEKIGIIAEGFDLTPEAAESILDARTMIDDMSNALMSSSTTKNREELLEAIRENTGSYLRRSYRMFEDTNFKPDEDAKGRALHFLADQERLANPNLSEDEVYRIAADKVEDILKRGEEEPSVYASYANVRKVNKALLSEKKEIPQPIRELMGEITDPSENLILTISKMSNLYETNKFYNIMNKTGSDAGYIRNQGEVTALTRDEQKNWVEITGTNSVLDGKLAPNEMVIALKNEQSRIGFTTQKNFIAELYRNYLNIKGAVQNQAVVYNLTSHIKNFYGALQFGTANGVSAFGDEAIQTLRVVKDRIAEGGDKALEDLYVEYQRLGITNTSVKINEFRELLDVGAQNGGSTLIERSVDKVKSTKAGRLAIEKPVEVYSGLDDYFKIVIYNTELDFLKRAFPGEDVELLKIEAARKVKDTVPNYDRVPNAIKAIRKAPLGNFVSFPAEAVRTQVNIIGEAMKEINSGSDVMRERGLRRLAGFAVTGSIWTSIANVSYEASGLSEEEVEAINTLTETPWSKVTPRTLYRGEDGMYTLDSQTIDVFSVMQEPVRVIYDRVRQGKMNGEEAQQYYVEALRQGFITAFKPFYEESILTKEITSNLSAIFSKDGRNGEGKRVVNPADPIEVKISDAFFESYNIFLPGTSDLVSDYVSLALGKKDDYTGKEQNLTELNSRAAGLKLTKVEPEKSLGFAVQRYRDDAFGLPSNRATYNKPITELVDEYVARERQRYRAMQELYRFSTAFETIEGRGEMIRVLEDKGLSMDNIGLLLMGKFFPPAKSKQFFEELIEKSPLGKGQDKGDLIEKINAAYISMTNIPLAYSEDGPTDEQRKKREVFDTGKVPQAAPGGAPVRVEDVVDLPDYSRGEYAKGGEVNVPQAPKEPDERIDRMTGLPYNMQAGDIMSEVEDRMGFSAGGSVVKAAVQAYDEGSKVFKTLKTKLGDLFDEEELVRVTDDIEEVTLGSARERSEMDPNMYDDYGDIPYDDFEMDDYSLDDMPTTFEDPEVLEDYIARSADVFLDEKIDKSLAELKAMPEWKQYLDEGRWEEFSRARGYTEEQIQKYAEHTELQMELDPDGSIYDAVTANLKDMRQAKEELGFNAPDIDMESEQLETLSDMMKYYMRNDERLAFLKEDKAEELGKRQVARMMNHEFYGPIVRELAEDIPQEIQTAARVSKPLPPKEREQAKMAFLDGSVEKKPIYRGITTFENKEFDISFAMPREIGAHVGTAGQANTIVARTLDPTSGADMRFSAPSRGFEPIEPTEWDEFYEEMAMDRAMDQQFASDMGEEILPTQPATISKGYIHIENPLVIEQDLGSWDAMDILIRDDIRKIFEDGIAAKMGGQVPDEFVAEIDKLGRIAAYATERASLLPRNSQDPEVEMTRVFLNRKFRGLLEQAGYDSIKYENLIEGTNVGEDEWSYILFKPQQYKAENAKRFDVNDKRFTYFLGGLVQKAVGIKDEDVEWAKALGESYGEREQLDGKGDAARHIALGWLAKKAKYPNAASFAINAREALNTKFERDMDVANNEKGFELDAEDRATAEARIKEMIENNEAKFYTPDESRAARGYAEGGEVMGDCMDTYNSIMEGLRGN